MIPATVYNINVTGRKGDVFMATCLDWPTLPDIRSMIESEILTLQQEAHSHDNEEWSGDTEFRVDRVWRRVEELKRLVDLLRVAVDPKPESAPYTVSVSLAGTEIGTINVVPAPAWRHDVARAPP